MVRRIVRLIINIFTACVVIWFSISMYWGYKWAEGINCEDNCFVDSKVKASTENHKRVNAFIAAALTHCETGQIVKLPGFTNVDCRSGRKYSSSQWRDWFITYFPRENAVFSCSTSSAGRTCLQASGANIYIRTYPGDANGNRGTLITSQQVIE